MLTNYKGPSNSSEVFQHLVGEKIVGAFQDSAGQVFIVVESGMSLVLSAIGSGSPAYWVKNEADTKEIVQKRRKEIEQKLAELRDMAGVDLP